MSVLNLAGVLEKLHVKIPKNLRCVTKKEPIKKIIHTERRMFGSTVPFRCRSIFEEASAEFFFLEIWHCVPFSQY